MGRGGVPTTQPLKQIRPLTLMVRVQEGFKNKLKKSTPEKCLEIPVFNFWQLLACECDTCYQFYFSRACQID